MSRIEKRVVAIIIAMFMLLSNITTGPVVSMAEEAQDYIVAVSGEEMVGTIEESNDNVTYSYVPEVSGLYTVESIGDNDTYGEIYDSAMNLIYSDNDSGDELNYSIAADLEEGQTYYIVSKMFSESETGDITTIINFNEDVTASDATGVTLETPDQVGLNAKPNTVETATLSDAGETVEAESSIVSGDYEYEVLEDNTIIITAYNGTSTTVSVPSSLDGKTVSVLGQLAFGGNNTVTSVTVPNTVTELQYGVFCGATNLKTVSFASNSKLDKIGISCFSMSGIENVTLPNNVTTVESHAFWNCPDLKTVNIPDSVTYLGNQAFSYCRALNNVTIGKGITALKHYMFFSCQSLETFILPENVEIIDYNCFSGSGLKKIVWNDCIKTIGNSAFSNTQLNELIIPDTITSIGDNAFLNCKKLKKVELGDNIISVSSRAFEGCSIEEIDLKKAKIIQWEAFYDNDALKSVVIPDSVTDLEYKAFFNSDNLISISMSKNIERLDGYALNDTAWYKAQADGVLYIDNVLYGYKGEMPSKTNLTVKEGTKVVAGVSFFSQPNLNSVELPYGVTNINEYAFFECVNMESIFIPSSVVEIIDYSIGYRIADKGEAGAIIPTGMNTAYPIDHSSIKKVDNLVIIGDKGTAAEAYAKKHGITFKEREIPAATVKYRTHVQSIGWQNYVSNGAMSGTSGMAKRLEGINIYVEGNPQLGIQYTTHCQSYGWLPWSADGDMNGTEGEAKRLEAIKIQLTGPDAKYYDVHYRVHAQSYGWLNWAKNGEAAGTAGYGKRLEGIQIIVVKKNASFDTKMGNIASTNDKAYIAKDGASPIVNSDSTSNTNPVIPGADTPNVTYRTHVQSFGWQGWKYNGQMSGTSGLAKRLEGININLTNKPCDGDIVYTTHVQTYGWKDGKPEDTTRASWKKNGAMSGTSGEAKRLEAICIDLTGEMGEKYDIYYRVHAQSYGWLGWAKNGEPSGTAGYGKRLEGIQIVLVKKGDPVPTIYYGNITSNDARPYISK